jgi:hypothetical protein
LTSAPLSRLSITFFFLFFPTGIEGLSSILMRLAVAFSEASGRLTNEASGRLTSLSRTGGPATGRWG